MKDDDRAPKHRVETLAKKAAREVTDKLKAGDIEGAARLIITMQDLSAVILDMARRLK